MDGRIFLHHGLEALKRRSMFHELGDEFRVPWWGGTRASPQEETGADYDHDQTTCTALLHLLFRNSTAPLH